MSKKRYTLYLSRPLALPAASTSTETLALFVRYFLTITPPLPQSEQEPARLLGKERFQVFVAQVGRRLIASGTAPVRDAYRQGAAQGYRDAQPSSGPGDPGRGADAFAAGPPDSAPPWAQNLARR
jgi:hypothetical protein